MNQPNPNSNPNSYQTPAQTQPDPNANLYQNSPQNYPDPNANPYQAVPQNPSNPYVPQNQPVYQTNVYQNLQQPPTGQYAPLSPWAYFGLQILFSIPIVGFVFLIVFSISSGNINRRNFARSYWCLLIIVAVVLTIVAIILLATGVSLPRILGRLF